MSIRKSKVLTRSVLSCIVVLMPFAMPAQSYNCYPGLPAPQLTLSGTTNDNVGGTDFTRYNLSVTNHASFPAELFESAPDLPPCGLNTEASRTWVNIFGDGTPVYGFCGLSAAEDLTQIWFAIQEGQTPPNYASITLVDRRCSTTYTSNVVRIGAPTPGAHKLISRNDSVHGLNSITIDPDTGLEWLDLTKTTGSSVNSVSSQLIPGGLFAGFRYATIAELTTLFGHAGIPNVSFGPGTLDAANYEPVVRLLDFIGSTVQSGGILQSFGFLGDAAPFIPANLAVGVLQAYSDSLLGSADPVQASDSPTSQLEIVGSFLVRVVTIGSLESIVQSMSLEQNQKASLLRILRAAQRSKDAGGTTAAKRQLVAFVAAIRALQIAGRINSSTADTLALIAQEVIRTLADDLPLPDLSVPFFRSRTGPRRTSVIARIHNAGPGDVVDEFSVRFTNCSSFQIVRVKRPVAARTSVLVQTESPHLPRCSQTEIQVTVDPADRIVETNENNNSLQNFP